LYIYKIFYLIQEAEHVQESSETYDLFSLIKNFTRINKLYAREIQDFHIRYNYSRFYFFVSIILFICAIELFFVETVTRLAAVLLYSAVGFALLNTAILFFLGRNRRWYYSVGRQGFIHITLFLYLLWSVLLLQVTHEQFIYGFAPFISILFGIAALFMLHPLYFLLLLLTCAGVLVGPVKVMYAPAFQLAPSEFVILSGSLFVSWIISSLHYLSAIELFMVRDKMERSENMAELALASGKLGYWNWDIKSEKIYVDARWFSMLGYPAADRVISFADFFELIMPGDRQPLANKIQSYLDGKDEVYSFHFRMQTKDGGWRWIYAQGQITIRDTRGKPICMHGIHQDIQDLQDRQKQLSDSEARFKAYTENSPVGIFIIKDFQFIYVNPEAIRITGYAQEELEGLKLLDIVHPDDTHDVIRSVRKILHQQDQGNEYIYRIVSRQGKIHWIEARVSLLEKNNPRFLLSVIDITARKNAEEKLKEYATLDELTGVYNRRVGISILEQQMHHTKRERNAFTICFVDVNGLKQVNDTWGHDEGDALLRNVVEVIQAKLRRGDILCRLGGDEFLMLFKNCNVENASRIWDRIEQKIEIMNSTSGKPYDISVSYGLLEYNHTMEITVNELINMADQKMYIDKKKRRATGTGKNEENS